MPVTIPRWTRGGFAVAAVVALALSACSPSDGPDETASSTSGSPSAGTSTAVADGSAEASPSKSASPTPVPASSKGPAKNWPVPKMPEAAKEHTLKGAAAFTKYYFDLIEYTTVTNEFAPISQVSAVDCELCQADIIGPAKKNKKNGGWNTGGEFDLTLSSAQKEGDEVWVAFKYEQAGGRVYDASKQLKTILKKTKEPVTGSFFLEWQDGWRVNSVEFAES